MPRALRLRPGGRRLRPPRERRGDRPPRRRRPLGLAVRGGRAALRRALGQRPLQLARRALRRPAAGSLGRARARADSRRAPGVGAARHGRRGLSDRQEVGARRGPGVDAQVRRLQRRRVGARGLQGSPGARRAAAPRARGPAARDVRLRLRAGLGLHPPRVRARGGGPARGARDPARRRAARRRRAGVGAPARARRVRLPRRLHPRRGVGAARVHGGSPRRAAQQAALPRHLRPARPADADELGRDAGVRAGDRRAWGRVVAGAGQERPVGPQVLLHLGPRRASRRLPGADGHDDARAARPGRRRQGRRRAAGVPARRRLLELPRSGQARHAALVRHAAGSRLDARRGRSGDRRRGHEPARRRHERLALLPRRVVRQVRALSRRLRQGAHDPDRPARAGPRCRRRRRARDRAREDAAADLDLRARAGRARPRASVIGLSRGGSAVPERPDAPESQ